LWGPAASGRGGAGPALFDTYPHGEVFERDVLIVDVN